MIGLEGAADGSAREFMLHSVRGEVASMSAGRLASCSDVPCAYEAIGFIAVRALCIPCPIASAPLGRP